MSRPSDLVQGTLDLLILKILALDPLNGWAISQRLKDLSSDVLQVSDGSLYPALHKLEQEGWITADGARARTTAARSSTRSRGPVGNNLAWEPETGTGSRQRSPPWLVSRRCDDAHRPLDGDRRLRLRSLFRRNHVERDLDDELQYHIDRQTDDNIGRGMSPGAARRAALVAFGGAEQVRRKRAINSAARSLPHLRRTFDTRCAWRAARRSCPRCYWGRWP